MVAQFIYVKSYNYSINPRKLLQNICRIDPFHPTNASLETMLKMLKPSFSRSRPFPNPIHKYDDPVTL